MSSNETKFWASVKHSITLAAIVNIKANLFVLNANNYNAEYGSPAQIICEEKA